MDNDTFVSDTTPGGGDPPPYLIEILHTVASPGTPVLRVMHEVAERLVCVARACPDCPAISTTVPPDLGFDSAVMVVHSPTCPLYLGAVRELRNGAA